MPGLIGDPGEDEGIVAQSLVAYGNRFAVCSMHFGTIDGRAEREFSVKEERRFRVKTTEGYRHVYKIPGVKSIDDHPEILWVTDAFEKKYSGSDPQGRKEYADSPVLAKHIARDIVHAGSGSSADSGPGDVHPAFWISTAKVLPRDWTLWGSGSFAEAYPDFARECAAYRQREWRWCEKRVSDADAWHAKKMTHEISSIDRLCGIFIGANLAEHPWIEFTSFGKNEPCLYCGSPVPAGRPVCPSCNRTVDYALLEKVEAQAGKKHKAN